MAERSQVPKLHGHESELVEQPRTRQTDLLAEDPLRVLSHEIRSPLTAIQAAVQVLQDEPNLSAHARQSIEIISRQATYIAGITDETWKGFADPQKNPAANLQDVDLIALTQDVLAASNPHFARRDQSLKTQFAGFKVVVPGDPTKLCQAQINLLTNASKFTQLGGTIHYEITQVSQEALITVRDNGAGIKRDQLHEIFEPFRRADDPNEQGGDGIGLALVKQIVDQHKGSILVASGGKNCGSEFSIRLPLSKHR